MLNRDQAYESLLEHFEQDSLKASTFLKYILQDKEGNYYEKVPEETLRRLAGELARIEKKYPNALSADEIYEYLKDFKKIIFQGSPMTGIGNDFLMLSLSNCIVIDSPEDSISGIFDKARDMANLWKRRCGVGIDISSLRPDKAPVNNSAKTSTGAWSFADLYSAAGSLIGQNNRRAALLVSMDIRHPDALKFARAKVEHGKVTSANISLRMTDEFFEAVEKDELFTQYWPLDSAFPQITTQVSAKDLFKQICEVAHATGDPGLLFWSTIQKYSPADCYPSMETISTNPCGEVPLSANDSCRLLSRNLTSYVVDPFTKSAFFDFASFCTDTMIAQRLADDLVDLEIEKLTTILDKVDTPDEKKVAESLRENAIQGRRVGIGTQGLADVFIMLGMTYGDKRSVALTKDIFEQSMEASYNASAILAQERGAFPLYDAALEVNHPFLLKLSPTTRKLIFKHGRRNIASLTNAPTGSIAIVAGTSSGIDPNFALKFERKTRKNHSDEPLDTDYVDADGERWVLHDVVAPVVDKWREVGKNPKKLPKYFIEAGDVDIEGRLEVQAAAQEFIDHSISNTFNLPEETPVEVIEEIYLKAWKYELKGVTVFRNNCKEGILSKESFTANEMTGRPEVLDCHIHTANVKKEKWTIIIGLLDGKPYEVFGGLSEAIELPGDTHTGKIYKKKYKTRPAAYNLELDSGIMLKDIGRIFSNDLYQIHTRMVSLGLRHGAKPSFIAEQLKKDKSDNDLTSFSKVLARVLSKYVDDGTRVSTSNRCPQCEASSLVYQDGCIVCMSCGYYGCE